MRDHSTQIRSGAYDDATLCGHCRPSADTSWLRGLDEPPTATTD